MTAMSKTGSRFDQALLKIDARRFCENNQQKCINCLKLRSNENRFAYKNCGFNEFYVFNYQNSSFEILSSL